MRSALAITIKTNQQRAYERLRRLINNPFHKKLLETYKGVPRIKKLSRNQNLKGDYHAKYE